MGWDGGSRGSSSKNDLEYKEDRLNALLAQTRPNRGKHFHKKNINQTFHQDEGPKGSNLCVTNFLVAFFLRNMSREYFRQGKIDVAEFINGALVMQWAVKA